MVEMAEIIRRYGPQYRAKYGERMLPSHRQAMRAIERCRTPALGGHIYHCEECEETEYHYHSCRNRHCPKCQNGKAQEWLEKQQDMLLPVRYFLVTVTLPGDLRAAARSHQKLVYDLLFRTSAAAMQHLARDARFVGGQLGMVGVLHILRLRSGQALGAQPELPSARALPGSRRSGGSGWTDLATEPEELFAPGEGALQDLSGQVL